MRSSPPFSSSKHFVPQLVFSLIMGIGGGPLPAGSSDSPISYAAYARVLEEYVDDQGLVDYAALKANDRFLREFLAELAQVSPSDYQSWPRADRIALWINAYNANTLKAILDHYPIRSSFLKSLTYPKNSIRQVSGVWDGLVFRVMGKDWTLDQMEHQVLRGEFAEARIHMALVCAALSCPPLRREPYLGNRLNEQFEQQARIFVSRTGNFRLEQGSIYLSKIFDWFGEDFVPRYGRSGTVGRHGTRESAVLQFLIPHLDPSLQEKVRAADFKIRYSDYDWTLNEQP